MAKMTDKDLIMQFHEDGYLKIEDCFDPARITGLHDLALDKFTEVQAIIEEKGHKMGIGVKYCFREIVQRHKHRYEMAYGMDSEEFAIVPACDKIMDVVRGILGDDCVVINKSLVVSRPGAETQAWHSDGPHLDLSKDLPCHCLNVFVPLVDVDENNGPTEMRPGSVALTRELKKSYMRAFLTKKIRPVDAPNLEKGSVLLFDYRILHRGKANNSELLRPVLVYTFAKPYYVDNMNFPRNSVHDEPKDGEEGGGEGGRKQSVTSVFTSSEDTAAATPESATPTKG